MNTNQVLVNEYVRKSYYRHDTDLHMQQGVFFCAIVWESFREPRRPFELIVRWDRKDKDLELVS